jgi:hypothetical protein
VLADGTTVCTAAIALRVGWSQAGSAGSPLLHGMLHCTESRYQGNCTGCMMGKVPGIVTLSIPLSYAQPVATETATAIVYTAAASDIPHLQQQ